MENEQDADDELEPKEKPGQGLSINRVPIHRRLKVAMKKALRVRKDIYAEDVVIADSENARVPETPGQLTEPEQKVTIIERAVGYFNAEKDEEASKSALNTSVGSGPPFSCTICKSWFYLGAKLKLHYILNHAVHHCQVCSALFPTRDEKDAHVRAFHSQSFCEICQTDIAAGGRLVEHYAHEHGATTCKFCGTLLRPQTSFASHVLRKHCASPKFLEASDASFMETLATDTEFFCALCQRNRDSEGFFGHMSSHHKISVTSLLNMMVQERVAFRVDGAKVCERSQGMQEEIVPLGSRAQGPRNTCRVCSLRFTRKTPAGFHAVYCQARVQCKHCSTRFASAGLRAKHVQRKHGKLACTLGCERLTFGSEETRTTHYATYHEIVACRYCEVFISVNSGTYDKHLAEAHQYTATVMRDCTDTLFEVVARGGRHVVVCCLCDANVTGAAETVTDIYEHYSTGHSVSAKRILQLVPAKPTLTEYEELYREINESIKTEAESGEENSGSPAQSVVKTELPSEDEQQDRATFDESKLHTDFDYQELEGLLQYESEAEQEAGSTVCELCGQEEPSWPELMAHLKTEHKVNSRFSEHRCDECSESFLSKTAFAAHLPLHQETSALTTLRCGCDTKVTLVLARSHILRSHPGDLLSYNVQELGLKCRFCELRFWAYEELNAHELTTHEEHNSSAFLKCYTCLTIFANQICLKRHTRHEHPDAPPYADYVYRCRQCSVASPSIALARQHFQAEHPASRVYLCPVAGCRRACSQPKYLRAHLRAPHRAHAAPAPCEQCGKVSKSLRAASIHRLMKHTRDRAGFQCRLCRERFTTSEQRKLHYATSHAGQLAYSCADCGKGFVSKSGLYGHRKVHAQGTTHACPYCGKQFLRKDSYSEHLLIHVGPRHQCPHCPKAFTQRSNLTRHVRIHTGVKPYACRHCDKRFSDQGACRSHERVHTKEEHCACSYCGKRFSKRQKLRYHIRFHTGEGLLDCDACGKQFSNAYALAEHRKIHDQQTLVVCGCGRGFASEKYLHRHMSNVHSQGAARYFCPICCKPIHHRSAYNDHVMTHAAVKHVKCLLCNTQYNTRKTVRKHLLEKHHFRPSDDFSAHIHQLSPAEAGLSVPSVAQLAELLDDGGVLQVDLGHQLPDGRCVKREPVTDVEEGVVTRAKRKVKQPVKLRPASEQAGAPAT